MNEFANSVVTWLELKVTGHFPLTLKAERSASATPFHDGSYSFDIRLTADGLDIHTCKSLHPSEITDFVRQFKALSESSTPVEISLRSKVTEDIKISVNGTQKGWRLVLSVCHGNSSMWRTEFSMGSPGRKLDISAG